MRLPMKGMHMSTNASTILLSAILLSGSVIAGCAQEEKANTDTAIETSANAGSAADELRIIPLGGSITETVYALGFGEKVVATDVSSTWPPEAAKLPQVGYQRTLSAENILALKPTLVIASTEAGPPTTIEQLRHAGVEIVVVPAEPTISGIRRKIAGVARALGVPAKGKELIDSIERALAGRDTTVVGTTAPRVMFIYSRGGGAMQVSGTETSADLMIRLAGGVNAVTDYAGFRPLTAEGVVGAAPDIILVPEKGLEAMGGIDGLLKVPGIGQTPAGRARRIVLMDDLYLLGLGPRTGAAVRDLANLFRTGSATAEAGA